MCWLICIILLQNLKPKIDGENEIFINRAKKDWKINKKKNVLKPFLKLYAQKMWSQKMDRILQYHQYYKPLSMIPISNEEEEIVEVVHLQNILELVCKEIVQ